MRALQQVRTPPIVTVVAVCYNHAPFVIECLDSIRNQTYQQLELVIMDDCSQDDSVAIICDWIRRNSIKCTFVAHQTNQGVCRTLNEALKLATEGKYVSLIAADDSWLPDKLAHQVATMETLPEDVGIIYSDAYQVDEHGLRKPEMFIEAHRKLGTMPEGAILDILIEGNFIPAMATLVRRTVYDQVGHYDERLLFEDWDFWLRAACHFRFAYSHHVVANYRILETSMMRKTVLSNNNAVTHTYFLIDRKILTFPRLGEVSRALVTKRIVAHARTLYVLDHPYAAHALAEVYIIDRQLRDLYWSLLAFLRIRHRRYRRVGSYIRWRLSSRRCRESIEKQSLH